ncbi:MAG: VOC family protein [Chloroflexota bacterium]
MGLEIYMVVVIVEEMPRAVEFYRRLGIEIPAGSESQENVEIKMGNMSFLLCTKRSNARWDRMNTEPASGGYRMMLEFYLTSREALDAKYAEMIGYGYAAHVAPYEVTPTLYFAMIDDPDGNTVLLSAFLGEAA